MRDQRDEFDAMLGKPIQHATFLLGAPTHKDAKEGETRYVWSTLVPAYACDITLTTDANGLLTRYEYKGDLLDCNAYSRKLKRDKLASDRS